MLGALAIVVCLVAAGGVGRILYFLYAPKVEPRLVARPTGRVIVEPLFSSQRPPVPPRARMARGTGGLVHRLPARDTTENAVVAPPR